MLEINVHINFFFTVVPWFLIVSLNTMLQKKSFFLDFYVTYNIMSAFIWLSVVVLSQKNKRLKTLQ